MVEALTVIPATSVYYETDFATGVFTENGGWSAKTDKDMVEDIEVNAADGPQDDGTVGKDQTYGYDSSYNNDAYLSNGSSRFVEGLGKNKTTTTFTFTGTGFDIISRTGETQGLIQVVVTDASGKQVKAVSVLNKSLTKWEIYQIPVLSIENLPYGTYTATIHVFAPVTIYTGALATMNRDNDFFFDAVRIYNPAQGNTEAEKAYAEDNEAGMKYYEVRQYLLSVDDYNVLDDEKAPGYVEGVTFVDCTYTGNNPDGVQGGEIVADYKNVGPNNEVYLAEGQGIVFKLTGISGATSIDIGAKSVAGDTAHIKAFISTSTTKPSVGIDKDIESATSQNYELVEGTTLTVKDDDENEKLAESAYIFIENLDDGNKETAPVLSITDLKIAYGSGAAPASEPGFESNPDTLAFAVACMTYEPEVEAPEEPTDPEVPEETLPEEPTEPEKPTKPTKPAKPEKPAKPVKPNYDIISAEFGNDKVQLFAKATLTVTTTQDVGKLVISNQYGFETLSVTKGYIDNDDGTRTWTVSVKADMIGKLKYTITGVGTGGVTGNSKTVSVKAKLI